MSTIPSNAPANMNIILSKFNVNGICLPPILALKFISPLPSTNFNNSPITNLPTSLESFEKQANLSISSKNIMLGSLSLYPPSDTI